MSASTPINEELLEKPLWHQLKEGWKQSGRAGVSMGKNFGTVGLLFSGTECALEYVHTTLYASNIW